jgi:two-component system, OmpR family, response regulator
MKHIDILIIDDEKKYAGMLAKRLELRDVSCDICYDGVSGLEWIRKYSKNVSMILLDLKLPDIYGIQVMANIKKIDPVIPVVILTGHGTQTDEKECMRLGAYGFVNKPISIDKILNLLNHIKGIPGCQ